MSTPQPPTRVTVLESVRRRSATTRADLIHTTGLSRSVVAQVVAELVAEGLLTEQRVSGPARRGRPSSTLQTAFQPGYAAGLDFGHRHIAVMIGDLHGRTLHERLVTHDVDADAATAFRIARVLLDDALRRVGATRSELVAVGVSVPFPVVGPQRTVRPFGHVPGWDSVRPRELLRADPGVAVVVDNDADAGAWGELMQDPGKLRSLLYVPVGDGLGAALIINGAVLTGAHGIAGEIGHVLVPGSRFPCRCGRLGCLDAVVSRAVTSGASPTDIDDAGSALGAVLAQLASFADPDVVILGGTLGSHPSRLAEATTRAYEEHSPQVERAPLRPAALGRRSELWGALDRAVQQAWTVRVGPISYALAR